MTQSTGGAGRASDRTPVRLLRQRAARAIGVPLLPSPAVTRAAVRIRNGLGRLHRAMAPPAVRAIEAGFGILDNRAVAVLVDLRLPEVLADGPATTAEVARRLELDEDALERFLGYVAGRGFVGRCRDHRWRANSFTEAMRRDAELPWWGWASMAGSSGWLGAWENLGHSLRTGRSGFAQANGADFFDHLTRVDPEAGRVFDTAMAAGGGMHGLILAATEDWTSSHRVCDVGGGTGALMARLLEAHPHLEGAVVDLPQVVEAGRAASGTAPWAARCRWEPGDFFATVPSGYDTYLLAAVVHDWDDASATTILTNVAAALPADGRGRVLVIDNVLPGHRGDDFARATDLLMLVLTGRGRERTAAQFDALARGAGLRVFDRRPLAAGTQLFELRTV